MEHSLQQNTLPIMCGLDLNTDVLEPDYISYSTVFDLRDLGPTQRVS